MRTLVCWPLSLFTVVALTVPVPAGAQVSAPILKWQRGGCFASWCQTGWYSSPAVADLDGDGHPEVVWGSYDVVAVDGATGALEWRAASSSRVWPGIVVADLVGDGTPEVVVGRSSDQLTVYDRNGSVVWTRNPFGSGEVRTLAVEDLEYDGRLDIVVGRASGGSTKQLSVYGADGTVRPGWPARRDGEAGYGWGMYNENVAVADLGGDGLKEIVGPTDTHYITALDRSGNQLPASSIYGAGKVWSQVGVHVDHAVDLRGYANCGVEHRPNFANSAPVTADLDGDGQKEIVVVGNVYDCSTDPYTDLYYMPFILRADRTRWAGSGFDWTAIPTPGPGSAPLSEDYAVIENAVPNPAVADLDGDGRQEILYPSYDGKLHAYWLDKTEHGSWPYAVPGAGIRFASEPVVADLDGDGDAEVIFTSWPQKSVGGTGQLHVLDHLGQPLHVVDLPAPFGGATWNGGLAAPTLDDIDSDSNLEVVVGTVSSGLVAYTLPNTGRARVLWGTGRGGYQRTGAAALRPQRRDFGGDGRGDVLWRHSASGAVAAWHMDGRFVERVSLLGSAAVGWTVQAVADFTGDGKADLLWRETASGTTYLWAIDGAAVTAASGFTSAQADPTWQVVGTGDVNGDGRSDILWRKTGGGPGTGNVVAWLMNGAMVSSVGSPGAVGSEWNVQGLGDLDGDGRDDILWRDTSGGSTYVWFMAGASVLSSGFTGAYGDTTWTIQGVADLNGDRKDDVLWRHAGGALYVWLMHGLNLAPGSTVLPPISLSWQVKALGDADGDGRADILWRETATGATYLWRMNGATTIGQGYTSSQADGGWAVQGP